MAPRTKAMRGYTAPYVWKANGDLTLFPTDATAPPVANGGPGSFDGIIVVPVELCFDTIRLFRRIAGGGGTTTIQVWRFRSAAWTLLATLSVTAAGGDMQSAQTTPVAPANILNAGDFLMVRFTAVETAAPTPEDVTVSLEWR